MAVTKVVMVDYSAVMTVAWMVDLLVPIWVVVWDVAMVV